MGKRIKTFKLTRRTNGQTISDTNELLNVIYTSVGRINQWLRLIRNSVIDGSFRLVVDGLNGNIKGVLYITVDRKLYITADSMIELNELPNLSYTAIVVKM